MEKLWGQIPLQKAQQIFFSVTTNISSSFCLKQSRSQSRFSAIFIQDCSIRLRQRLLRDVFFFYPVEMRGMQEFVRGRKSFFFLGGTTGGRMPTLLRNACSGSALIRKNSPERQRKIFFPGNKLFMTHYFS